MRTPERESDTEGSNTITPLDGEAGIPKLTQPARVNVSRKGLFAVALLAVSLMAVTGVSITRAISGRKDADETSKRLGDRPAAAGGDPRRLDMTSPLAGASRPGGRLIPAIEPTPEERRAEPIPLRANEPAKVSPEDAPVLLVTSRPVPASDPSVRRPAPGQPSGDSSAPDNPLDSTRRNLETYQRQLQGVVDSLTKGTTATPSMPPTQSIAPAPTGTAGQSGLFGGDLQKSSTPRVAAGVLGDRSLILPKGTSFTCALKTKVVSAASGFVGCQVQRNVFSDDGHVLLVERGAHLDGEYRIAAVRPGTVRLPVLWTRLRTPNGVTVDLESPGTGPLGESGIDGDVDNRWPERIGAAMLLSLIDDSVKLAIEDRSSAGNGNTIVLPSTTSNTSKLAEKVLDSTINIPPLIYQNQGGIVGIYVARDVDFAPVYELKATPR